MKEFFGGLEGLKPDPGESHELLLNKASRLIDHYFQLYNLSLPPSHTSLDVARHLESLNIATPAGLGTDPALNLLLELHNPASELYIEATKLLLRFLSLLFHSSSTCTHTGGLSGLAIRTLPGAIFSIVGLLLLLPLPLVLVLPCSCAGGNLLFGF